MSSRIKNLLIITLLVTNIATWYVLTKWSTLVNDMYIITHNSYKIGCLEATGLDCEEKAAAFTSKLKGILGE